MFTTKFSRIAIAILSLGVLAGTTGLASAKDWDQKHPRRAEVNGRLAVQNLRIKQEVREGDLSHKQAKALHAEDRTIRKEERFMASQNHGHINRAEQHALNQQENKVSHKIGR